MTTTGFTENTDVRVLSNLANAVEAGSGDDIVLANGGADSVLGEDGEPVSTAFCARKSGVPWGVLIDRDSSCDPWLGVKPT